MKNPTRILCFLLLGMGLIGATGWAGRKVYRRVTTDRLVGQARHFTSAGDFANARLCLGRALQINSFSVAANRAVADLLEAQGSPFSVEWRKRVVQLEPDNATNRFALAEGALRLQDNQVAEEALRGVVGAATNSAAFWKLSGALAWAQGRKADAERFYSTAVNLEPSNQVSRLNLATVHIASTNPAVAANARKDLEQLVGEPVCHLTALRYLLADSLVQKAPSRAVKFSNQIVQDPAASPSDKIDYLQLLKTSDADAFGKWLASLKQESQQSSLQAFALAKWMVLNDGPTNTLGWLQSLPRSVQTNQPVPLIVTDCQLAVQDWNGLQTLVGTQDWAEVNYYRLALMARAERALERQYTYKTAWNKALHESHEHLERLTRLAQVSDTWGWKAERMEVLREIVEEFPKAKWASTQLVDQLYANGNTQELKELLARFYSEEPGNPRLKNAFANVSLLRKTELEKAYRLSKEAHDSLPDDPYVISTYSYALLLQHKPEAALEELSRLKPEALRIPEVAGIYGVVQAESGHKDLAKANLELAEAANLLPEEKELVRVAKAGL